MHLSIPLLTMKTPLRTLFSSASCALFVATLSFGAEFNQRLANLSTRAQVGVGSNVATVGFVIGAGSSKNILIRAVGPTLGASPFNVPGVNSDPQITIFNAAGVKIASNDNWGTVAYTGAATSATLASTFSSVGAFAYSSTTSKDAAILATNLAPGNYTAQVSGVGTTSGVALVEIYDVTGSARLLNLSTSAQVGSGAGVIISGLSIASGGGARKILVRAAGPALSAFGVSGALSDPAIAVFDSTGTQIASNDNWDSDNAAALKAAFAASGAFAFTAGSKDSALLIDLQPGANYTVQVSGVRDVVNNRDTTGLALVEVYDVTSDNTASVAVAASVPSTDTKGAAPGAFTFSRSGGTTGSPLTVYYSVSGAATPGVDFTSLPGSVTIPAGATSATVNVAALSTGASATINKDVSITLLSGTGYTIGANSSAAVTIFYNPGTLYLAALRTPSTATASTAYGTASVQLSSDNTFALVNVAFSNLSSPETAVYLRLANPGAATGTEVLRLASGQVSGSTWVFQNGATFTAAQLVSALQSGQIYLDIETAQYPTSELQGTFIQSSGSLVFTPPPAAPALVDNPLTAADAARFLTQATFGPMRAEIDALTGKHQIDLANWITAQMAQPPSGHLAATDTDFQAFAVGDNPQYSQQNRQAAWWKIAVSGPDQLRQRVAFALSQILVVSDVNSTVSGTPRGAANYYDILVNDAFGNFRTLLEDVTLNPVMGIYLSTLRNAKGTFDVAGNVVTSADENYAREVMQLFTIGLNQLQPDGTLKLDPTGLPIPTYNQTTITQVSKVFTGWAFLSADATSTNNFRSSASDYLHPMMLYPGQHDTTAKTIVGGVVVPANQGGVADLKLTLDTLFNHSNTAPFISRLLIQRLVTSNPSPGYVYRVAQVFANNGSGVRGDLGAVVRAILLDYEARSAAVAATASFGKLKEPVLRATALLRGFGGGANNGRFAIFSNDNATTNTLVEYPLHAPTVFNFYLPNFIEPGAIAAAGLYAPEFQILTDTSGIAIPNQLWNFIYASRSATNAQDGTVGLDLSSLIPYARTPAALVDQVNTIFAAGSLSAATTARMSALISALPATTTGTPSITNGNDLEHVRSAVYLAISTQQGAIQK